MPSRGTFVLADIGGYTSFLTGVAIEHATEITEDLLNTILRCNRNRWNLANIEGDCIFFYTEGLEPPAELVDHIRRLYKDFCGRTIDIAERAACPCGACTRTGELRLKFIVHTGEFETQRIADRTELVGADVITAHRLLKNSVPLDEYIIITNPDMSDLDTIGLPVINGTDTYEHSGTVEYSALDLAPVRDEIRMANRIFVEPKEAKVSIELTIHAPPQRVWTALTDHEERLKWEDLRESIALPPPKAAVADMHRCVFPDGSTLVQIPIAVDPKAMRKTERWRFTNLVKNTLVTLAVNGSDNDISSEFGCYMTYELAIPVVSRLFEPVLKYTGKTQMRKSYELLKEYCERESGQPS